MNDEKNITNDKFEIENPTKTLSNDDPVLEDR